MNNITIHHARKEIEYKAGQLFYDPKNTTGLHNVYLLTRYADEAGKVRWIAVSLKEGRIWTIPKETARDAVIDLTPLPPNTEVQIKTDDSINWVG